MTDWADHALQMLAAGQSCALISLLAVEGSTPREVGTRMVVTVDAQVGTIGGGNLEFLAIQQARAVLDQPPGTWRIQDYPLGPLLGQCCGGRVRLMVERLDPAQSGWLNHANGPVIEVATRLFADRAERHVPQPKQEHMMSYTSLARRDGEGDRPKLKRSEGEGGWWGDFPVSPLTARGPIPTAGDGFTETIGQDLTPLLMFGAGHVGQAIAKLLPGLPFAVDWCDSRSEGHPATLATSDAMEAKARTATGLVLILTHDHALDYRLTTAALQSLARFIGLIGSATKRARFLSRLKKDGFGDDDLSRLTCPIGIEGITGKAPQTIAVSAVAQLLLRRADMGLDDRA